MVYLYDNAIVDDLKESFVSTETGSSVRVVDPQGAVDIVAQLQDDAISFPVVVLTRDNGYEVDRDRFNFGAAHFGQLAHIDKESNKLYDEKVLPIQLTYNLTILATNTADMDELVKELMFKYINMYFLTISLPYESKRKIRFGVSIDPDIDISQSSGSFEYIQSGSLYQTIIPLTCQGCVLLSYTPRQLEHIGFEPEIQVHRKYINTEEEKI